MSIRLVGIILTFLFGVINQSVANDSVYGFGVGVQHGIKIYMPVEQDGLLIEPTLFIFSRDDELSSGGSVFSSDITDIEVGLGLFKNKRTLNDVYLNYGVRFGYIDSERSSSSSGSSSKTNEDGYFVAPTVGAQYFIVDNFSVGIEAAIRYEKIKGTDKNASSPARDVESSGYNTDVEIIVRYRFD